MTETISHSLSSNPYEGQIRASLLEGESGSLVSKLPLTGTGGTRTYDATGLAFRGRLDIEGAYRNSRAMQDFTIYQPSPMGLIIKNYPIFPTPSIEIELAASSLTSPFQVVRFAVRPTGESVDSEIEYTRLFSALAMTRKCSLTDKAGKVLLSFKMQGVSSEGNEKHLYRAKLFRKLKFIETVFHTRFQLPTEILPVHAQQLEIVFRGITEGEFEFRGDKITLYNFAPLSTKELFGPPFTEPGFLNQLVGEKAPVFDRFLDVGPVFIQLDRAVIANQQALVKLRAGETLSQVDFIVLDHQIRHRFERYAILSPQSRRRRLIAYKRGLMVKEPEALVSLMEEPLSSDVSADEAVRIVNGWLQFNAFPDRYCPQVPRLHDGRWIVPIWVTFPNGRGSLVQDAYVDLRTGVVTVPISVKNFRDRGKSVAAECLREG
jgi:hypothetical protein